jgi:transcriptional accessory protein Tex/SPT6
MLFSSSVSQLEPPFIRKYRKDSKGELTLFDLWHIYDLHNEYLKLQRDRALLQEALDQLSGVESVAHEVEWAAERLKTEMTAEGVQDLTDFVGAALLALALPAGLPSC